MTIALAFVGGIVVGIALTTLVLRLSAGSLEKDEILTVRKWGDKPV